MYIHRTNECWISCLKQNPLLLQSGAKSNGVAQQLICYILIIILCNQFSPLLPACPLPYSSLSVLCLMSVQMSVCMSVWLVVHLLDGPAAACPTKMATKKLWLPPDHDLPYCCRNPIPPPPPPPPLPLSSSWLLIGQIILRKETPKQSGILPPQNSCHSKFCAYAPSFDIPWGPQPAALACYAGRQGLHMAVPLIKIPAGKQCWRTDEGKEGVVFRVKRTLWIAIINLCMPLQLWITRWRHLPSSFNLITKWRGL